MKTLSRPPRIGRPFEPFLFASVGEDRHGQPLSVLSALARSDLDPWEEAARLARMSRRKATVQLGDLMAALPGEPFGNVPTGAIAAELSARLPERDSIVRSLRRLPVALESEMGRFKFGVGALAIMTAFALLLAPPPSFGRKNGSLGFRRSRLCRAGRSSVAFAAVAPGVKRATRHRFAVSARAIVLVSGTNR